MDSFDDISFEAEQRSDERRCPAAKAPSVLPGKAPYSVTDSEFLFQNGRSRSRECFNPKATHAVNTNVCASNAGSACVWNRNMHSQR